MLLLALTVSGSLGRHYIAMFEATQNVMLKPAESWREALLDTRVMDLFFTVSDLPPPPHPSPAHVPLLSDAPLNMSYVCMFVICHLFWFRACCVFSFFFSAFVANWKVFCLFVFFYSCCFTFLHLLTTC